MAVTVNSLTKKTTKEGVRVFKEWGTPSSDPLLSVFLNTQASTKERRSLTMQALDTCNLLYIVQSQADRSHGIYEIGVSKGVGRLHEYVKHHGEPESKKVPQKSRCSGVFLVYLAGQQQKGGGGNASTAGKRNADTVDSYATHAPWTRRKEKQIFEELGGEGFKPVRGKEWYLVKTADMSKLREIVEKSTGAATRDRAARVEKDMHLNKGDKVVSVEYGAVARRGPNKGKIEYGLKWNRPFPLTRAQIAKRKKSTSVEPATLTKLYARESTENKLSAGRGTAAVDLVHAYIKKRKTADPDLRLQRRAARGGTLRELKPNAV